MKKFLIAVSLFLAGSAFAADPALVTKAQGLKNLGDFKGAAEVHPKELCKAMYLWEAACQVVGHKNASGDWVINKTLTPGEKTMGLDLLAQAQTHLDASASQDGTENQGCKGVDPDDLSSLIEKVKNAIGEVK